MTTTNGTRAILASLDADQVLVAAFPNFGVTVQRLHAEDRDIHVVCAGTEDEVSYEDALLAGGIARHLRDLGGTLRNDEAELVAGLWTKVEDVIWTKSGDRDLEKNPLVRYLVRGRGGRQISELGLMADIEAAARMNNFEHHLIAELRRDPLRIVVVW